MRLQARGQFLNRVRAVQLLAEQRNRHLHPGVVICHNRRENRRVGQTRNLLHFGQVLVRLRQTVGAGRIEVRRAGVRLVLGDHLLAAAAVPGQGEAGKQRIRRNQPRGDQRRGERNEPAGVAARHGDVLPGGDGIPMLLGHFREAVRPAGGNAVRRRGIKNARIAAFCQRDGFSCSSVRQAEDGNVGGVNGFASGIGVLALFFRERQERKLPALRQPIENPKACCAFLAINKDRPCHDIPPPFMRNRRINIQTYYTHIGALVKRKSTKKSGSSRNVGGRAA